MQRCDENEWWKLLLPSPSCITSSYPVVLISFVMVRRADSFEDEPRGQRCCVAGEDKVYLEFGRYITIAQGLGTRGQELVTRSIQLELPRTILPSLEIRSMRLENIVAISEGSLKYGGKSSASDMAASKARRILSLVFEGAMYSQCL